LTNIHEKIIFVFMSSNSMFEVHEIHRTKTKEEESIDKQNCYCRSTRLASFMIIDYKAAEFAQNRFVSGTLT